MMNERDAKIIEVARQAIEEKHGEDVLLLSPGSASGVADHYLIASVASEPQLRAMASFVERTLREKLEVRTVNPEADGIAESGGWVLLDYGNVLVHIMLSEVRARYDLESFVRKLARN
ncbi:MAG: ribosome silencing factor [Victivallaceae bacterium]|nr:ribosome silencing factor [Victivallaceae bacterium]